MTDRWIKNSKPLPGFGQNTPSCYEQEHIPAFLVQQPTGPDVHQGVSIV